MRNLCKGGFLTLDDELVLAQEVGGRDVFKDDKDQESLRGVVFRSHVNLGVENFHGGRRKRV